MSSYVFTPSSGTYTSIASGTTALLSPDTDEGLTATIPIGFSFTYDGVSYSQVIGSSNGWLSFTTSLSDPTFSNSLTNSNAIRPALYPLWDDLDMFSGFTKYQTTGVVGSRIFTFEWNNAYWDFLATNTSISFQVKLYEGTNVIQFVYNQEAGAVESFSNGATIGISGTASGDYLILNNPSATPTASSSTFTTDISSRPATGQVYQFGPAVACSSTPTGGTAAALPTTVACANTNIALSVTGATTGLTGLSYQWQSSPDGSTWTDISGATSTIYTATIGANTYFRRATICSGNRGNSLSVLVSYTGGAAPTGTGGTRCGIGTVSLSASGSATLNWYSTATGGTSLGTGSPFITPSITATTTYYVASLIAGSPSTGTIGAGASTSTGYESPYYYFYGGKKAQYLILASEMTTAGLSAGPLSSLGFDVVSANSTFLNFNISIKQTLLTALTSTLQTGLTSVYSVASVTPVTGINTYTFGSAFTWDGSSNIIVEVCWSNNNAGGTGTTVRYDATSFVSNAYYRVDNQTSAVVCATTTGTSTISSRPKMIFGYTSQCATGRSPVVATVTPAPAIAVNATNNPICLGNSTTITASSTNVGYTYNWVPGGANPLTVSPTSATQYVVTATDAGSGCVNKDSVTIAVSTVAPTAPAVSPGTTTLCPNDNPVLLTASGSTQANILTFGTQANQNTGVVASTDYPAPYTVYYGGQRMQMLVLASELTAAGYSNGSQFTSLQFPVVSRGSNWPATTSSCQSFQVSVGATALTSLSAFQTGLTQVIAPANFTPVVGYTNTHTFSTPFTWNGTSNIIVETTFSNNIFGTTSDLVVQYNSPTSFQSTIVYRADNVTAVAAAAATSINYSYSARPDFKLNGTKSVSTYYWSPITGLYTNAAGTTAYTGTSAATVYASPASTQTYTATASNGCVSTGTNVTITVTTPGNASGLAATTGGLQVCSISSVIANTTKRFFDGSCNLIAKVQSTGVSPLAGNVNACVKIAASTMFYNSEPYLMRHFDIEPSLNASAATARVTLYVLQSEFNDYNTNCGWFPKLPTGPADVTGIANLRVSQAHGTYSTQPLPGYYSGGAVLIDPADAAIVWNTTNSCWEISFDVTGFSGFFIHTTINGYPLSAQFISLTGKREGGVNALQWKVPGEQNIRGYEVERSYDGQNFAATGFVNSQAPGGNSSTALQYYFTDNNFSGDKQYYRLKQTGIDGRITISPVILIKSAIPALLTLSGVFPNPASHFVNAMIESPVRAELTILLSDISGRVLQTEKIIAEKGTTVIPFNTEQLAGGTYLVKVICGLGCENAVMKFVKQ